MKKIINVCFIVAASSALVGCIGLGAKQVNLSTTHFGTDRTTYNNVKETIQRLPATPLGATSSLRFDRYVNEYLNKKSSKAMYGAYPLSCNYRYYWSGARTELEAMRNAKNACQDVANDKNKLLGSDCNCRLVALGNTLLYSDNVYQGMHNIVPMRGLVEGNDGTEIELKGLIEVIDAGRDMSPIEIKNGEGKTLCSGRYDIRERAKGRIELSCFESTLKGSGEFVNTDFDTELRIPSGTALINFQKGETLKIIFGRDAL